jgi:metal-responsive CopG/Arc/MetJ family transcriptional regulator
VKTAVSIPDDLFREAEKLAHRLGKSRSELVADALREHVRRHGDATITNRLDAVYDDVALDDQDRAWLDVTAAGVAERNPW